MCYLLTIGTRESAASVKALLDDGSSVFVYPAINPSLKSLFPATDRLFHVTAGQCSCKLVSEDKGGGPPDAVYGRLRKLALAKGGLRAFVHWYSGQFDTEGVSCREKIRVPIEQFVDASVLGQDRVVDVRRSSDSLGRPGLPSKIE